MADRVVVVDDDKVTLTMLEKTLTEAGFEVFAAQDGMKALSIIQTESPDIVISDLLIPKIHGLELCQRIRENALLKSITVILMSAVYDYRTFRPEIERVSADYFITKPLEIPGLIELLQNIMQEKEPDRD